MRKKILGVGILLGLIFVAACEPRKEPIVKTIDRTSAPVIITVYVYDTQRELDEAYRRLHNIRRGDDSESRYGFARWPEWYDKDGNMVSDGGPWTCEIHMLEPKYIDDERTLTLGHEMVHCLYGSYHK
jgi:hypothetical protein